MNRKQALITAVYISAMHNTGEQPREVTELLLKCSKVLGTIEFAWILSHPESCQALMMGGADRHIKNLEPYTGEREGMDNRKGMDNHE